MGRLAAAATTSRWAGVAVSVPVSLEPIERLLGVYVSWSKPILHREGIVCDGNVSLVVDLDLDGTVGGSPVVTKLIIVTVNLAVEAESFILNRIDALDSDKKKEKKRQDRLMSKRP